MLFKFWIEKPVRIMKVDIIRFYRIVISTIKVKTLNITKTSIEEVGRAAEKAPNRHVSQTGTLYIVTKYLFLQFTLYNKPIQSTYLKQSH